MIDYAKRPKRTGPLQTKVLSRGRVDAAGALMDAAYGQEWGKRGTFIHCQASRERSTPGWAVTPERRRFYDWYPNNITVYAKIVDGRVAWQGWLFHWQALAQMVSGRDPGTAIIMGSLNPMNTFDPTLAH